MNAACLLLWITCLFLCGPLSAQDATQDVRILVPGEPVVLEIPKNKALHLDANRFVEFTYEHKEADQHATLFVWTNMRSSFMWNEVALYYARPDSSFPSSPAWSEGLHPFEDLEAHLTAPGTYRIRITGMRVPVTGELTIHSLLAHDTDKSMVLLKRLEGWGAFLTQDDAPKPNEELAKVIGDIRDYVVHTPGKLLPQLAAALHDFPTYRDDSKVDLDVNRTALELFQRKLQVDQRQRLWSNLYVAYCETHLGQYDAARERIKTSLATLENSCRLTADLRADHWERLAWVEEHASNQTEAAKAYLKACDLLVAKYGSAYQRAEWLRWEAAGSDYQAGEWAKAIPLYEAVKDYLTQHKPDLVETHVRLLRQLADAHEKLKQHKDALKHRMAALGLWESLNHDDFDAWKQINIEIGDSLWPLKRFSAKWKLLSHVYEEAKTRFGANDVRTLRCLWELAAVRYQSEEYDLAIPHYKAAYEGLAKIWKPDRSSLMELREYYADCLTFGGQPAEAIPLYKQNLSIQRADEGALSPKGFAAIDQSFKDLRTASRRASDTGALEFTLRAQRELLDEMKVSDKFDKKAILDRKFAQAQLLRDLERYQDCFDLFQEVYEGRLKVCKDDPNLLADTLHLVGGNRLNLLDEDSPHEDHRRVISELQEALRLKAEAGIENDWTIGAIHRSMGTAYTHLGDSSSAEHHYRRALDSRVKSEGPTDEDTDEVWHDYLWSARKFDGVFGYLRVATEYAQFNEKYHGPHSVAHADALFEQASGFCLEGLYERAQDTYRQIIRIFEAQEEIPFSRIAYCEYCKAWCVAQSESGRKAFKSAQAAYRRLRQFHPFDHEDVSLAANLLLDCIADLPDGKEKEEAVDELLTDVATAERKTNTRYDELKTRIQEAQQTAPKPGNPALQRKPTLLEKLRRLLGGKD